MNGPPTRPNHALLLPYLLPYLLYTGIASIPGTWLGPELNYALRIVASGAALAWGWGRYVSLRGPCAPAGSILLGIGAGLLGTALWVALLRPFVGGEAESWSAGAFWLRLAAAGALVPIFEELLMRGYVLRLVLQWEHARRAQAHDAFTEAFERRSIAEVAAGVWSPHAVLISSVVFALGHSPTEWLAALAYGLLMAGLWILRKDLLSCVAAHATTNISLAIYVRATGHWALW